MTKRQNQNKIPNTPKTYDKFKVLTPEAFYEIRKTLFKLGYVDEYVKRELDLFSYRTTPKPPIGKKIVYIHRTQSKCMLVFYTLNKRNQLMLTFKRPTMTGGEAYREFKKIAKKFGEEIPVDGLKGFDNKVYGYFNDNDDYINKDLLFTSLDQNKCYSYLALQPVADYRTKKPCTISDVIKGDNEFYKAEGLLLSGDLVNEIVHKDDKERIARLNSIYVKFYKYESIRFCPKTIQYITDMSNKTANPDTHTFYKEVMNKFLGYLKRNDEKHYKTNNATVYASIYARNKVEMQTYVRKFTEKGYTVMMVKTDAIKIVGKYNEEDNIVVLGSQVGEFKIENSDIGNFQSKGVNYIGDSEAHSGVAKYRQNKGESLAPLTFEPDNLDEEMDTIKKYAYIKGEKTYE